MIRGLSKVLTHAQRSERWAWCENSELVRGDVRGRPSEKYLDDIPRRLVPTRSGLPVGHLQYSDSRFAFLALGQPLVLRAGGLDAVPHDSHPVTVSGL